MTVRFEEAKPKIYLRKVRSEGSAESDNATPAKAAVNDKAPSKESPSAAVFENAKQDGEADTEVDAEEA